MRSAEWRNRALSDSALRVPQSSTLNARLQKFLADAGVASRRAAEQIILAGRVAVNGQPVSRLGTKVDPGT